MDRALILIFQPLTSVDSINSVKQVIKCLDLKTLILALIDQQQIVRIASNEGIKEEAAQEHLTNAAYENLYYLEEIFKNDSVDVTISAKQMSLLDSIVNEIKKLHPRILCIVGRVDTTVLELIRDSVIVPIILLPAEEK